MAHGKSTDLGVWKTLLPILCTITVAVAGYVVRELGVLSDRYQQLQVSVAEIKANRFDSNQATQLRSEIIQLQLKPPKAPEWVIRELSRNSELLGKLDSRLDQVEKRRR